MQLYHKIQSIYKRTQQGVFILGEYATKEIEYLADMQWEWTEKVDGTNIRIGIDADGTYRVGGRTERAQIPAVLLDSIAALNLREKLPGVTDGPICLYGEGYGGSIQKAGATYGNPQRFVLFDVRIGDWWLLQPDVNDIASKLGIDVVPIVGRGTLAEGEEHVRHGMVSTWGAFEAEGIVCRPMVPLFDRRGRRVIVKLKTKDYRKLEAQ